MEGAVIQELAERLRKPEPLGDDFIARPSDWVIEDRAALVRPGPLAATLAVSTLGAVRDYLKANKDSHDVVFLSAHVVSPTVVKVIGALDDRARVRETFVTATASDLTENFLGRFMPLEEFNIGLQIRFVDVDDRSRVLGLLSNVKSEVVKTALDDGTTQVVEARQGVALVRDVAVPNPVKLCAYRTFRDIEQPSSLYVLRVTAGKAGGFPEAGLFEADGGAWRLSAISRIHDWLVREIPADVAVLA
jgi:hypothetical protein